MSARPERLGSLEMARFVARGLLRFDALVPEEINQAFLSEVEAGALPVVPAGVPLAQAYPERSAPGRLLALPRVRGVLESLVGPGPRFDHHFLHRAPPASFFAERGWRQQSQHLHQDSTIDPRTRAFDVQILYFPHEVTPGMGGTRFVPGSHLRVVSEAAIGRYQNLRGQQHVVCPAGTLLFAHHGLWHGGGCNSTERERLMFKIRLNPTVPQCRLWNTDDLDGTEASPRPIFLLRDRPDPAHLHSVLCEPQPWFENDTGRLELIGRIRLWRRLLGDERFDADYWLTRLENEP
jgi:hypothetical protein